MKVRNVNTKAWELEAVSLFAGGLGNLTTNYWLSIGRHSNEWMKWGTDMLGQVLAEEPDHGATSVLELEIWPLIAIHCWLLLKRMKKKGYEVE